MVQKAEGYGIEAMIQIPLYDMTRVEGKKKKKDTISLFGRELLPYMICLCTNVTHLSNYKL